ncbi:MAG: hypothetical protein ACRDPF_32180 [Streptosporangiaceae bacterium]
MKIVVIGGSGLIGSKLVTGLREWGHETLAASPNSGERTLLPGAGAILGQTRYSTWPGRTSSGK